MPWGRQVLKKAERGLIWLSSLGKIFVLEVLLGSHRKGIPIPFTTEDLPDSLQLPSWPQAWSLLQSPGATTVLSFPEDLLDQL